MSNRKERRAAKAHRRAERERLEIARRMQLHGCTFGVDHGKPGTDRMAYWMRVGNALQEITEDQYRAIKALCRIPGPAAIVSGHRIGKGYAFAEKLRELGFFQ